ncbi:MAG: MipA/OmpV family protein [Pseudomonadota bacterium]
MNMQYRFLIPSLILTGLVLAEPVQAKELGVSNEERSKNFSVGLGAGLAPDYEGSDDYEVIPMPRFRYENDSVIVQTNGPGVEVDFFTSRAFDLGPIVRYNGGRNDVEDDVVDRLNDVDETIEAGAFIGAGTQLSSLGIDAPGSVSGRVTYLQDIIDEGHGGYTVGVSGSYQVPVHDKTMLISTLGTTYASDDYVESLFDVSAAESGRTGLQQFSGESGFKDVSLSFVLNHRLNEDWSVAGIGAYSRLLGDPADSPIVEDRGSDNQFLGGIVVSYDFNL